MGDFLDPGVDRRSPVGSPVGSPAPAHQVGMQKRWLKMKECQLCGGRYVVVPQRLRSDRRRQGIGHAQGIDEVMDATVLRKPSAHRPTLRTEAKA
ncbi:hypothetical protein D3C76_1504840 [compost metagenome]